MSLTRDLARQHVPVKRHRGPEPKPTAGSILRMERLRMAKLRTAAVRNRPVTERKLTRAVEKLLARGGFGMLGLSAVAREAGVDKKLIYRYFGNLDGLVTAVVQSPGFFPTLQEICDGDIAAMRARPAPQRIAMIAGNYARALIKRPVVLAM